MSVFDDRIATTLGLEGGYTNDRADHGGETIWGITAAVARAFGYQGYMQAMSRDEALAIYRARYWTQPQFDQISLIDEPISARMLDCGINCGPSVPARFLQRALNVLNNQAQSFPDLTPDGNAGAMTRAAMQAFIAVRGAPGRVVLLSMIRAQQATRYMEIAEADPTQEKFEWGWQLNRAA